MRESEGDRKSVCIFYLLLSNGEILNTLISTSVIVLMISSLLHIVNTLLPVPLLMQTSVPPS